MTNYELAKQTRDENISKHLSENTSVYTANVKLNDSAAEFIDNTQKKKTLMADLNETTKGYTTNKADARELLTESLLDICGIATAFAHDNGNNPLLQLVDLSKTDFNRLGQEVFDSIADKIVKIASDNLITMADYGMTKDLHDEAEANHTDYKTAKPLPAEIEAKITATNTEIDNLQERNDLLLSTKLERLIPIFRRNHSDFVDAFHSLNKIINPAVNHTKVHALITDINDNPIPNVTITFHNQNHNFKIATGTNGEITEKIPYGIYEITLSKEGYNSITLSDIKIKKGQTHQLRQKMS